MSSNPFIPEADSYSRKITPIQDYIKQASAFLSRERNIPYEQAEEYVRKLSLGKQYPTVRIPNVHYLQRGENGDRSPRCTPVTTYLKEIIKNKEIAAPTLTTYLPESEKESLLAQYIEGNITKRSKAKKEMFAAKAAKDDVGELFGEGKQRNFKLNNNAISGAHASSSNPLYNPTSHSTLTSNCRMTSAFGNANNEKMLTGNRHYHSPDIVLNNIVSIVSNTKYDQLQDAVDKYQLHLPTVEETIDTITYSTDLYWTNPSALKTIESYISKLKDIERAAFVYTGDLYHLKKYNPEVIRKFITDLSRKACEGVDNPIDVLKGVSEDVAGLAHQICATEMKGRGKDYAKMVLDENGARDIPFVAATAVNIVQTMTAYSDFIKAFLVTDNVPASISHFPSSIRRAALTSDTDSTIFTAQDWVLWLNNGKWWGEEAVAYGATIIFLTSQAIIHILARMSINNGIKKEKMYKVAMKNEFFFPVFIPTSVNKHYYASMSAQEGNIYDEVEREIKGVHLKNSNSPKFIIKHAKEMMNEIMDTVMAGEKIHVMKFIKKVADIERTVYAGIRAGERQYFRGGVIKSPNSYNSEPERSPYFHFMLWQSVFMPKYGEVGDVPLDIINVSTTLKTPTALAAHINGLEDKALATRWSAFLELHGRKNLSSIQVPIAAIGNSGLPVEIASVVDARSIVINLCKIFYLILETLGFSVLNKKSTFLVSDQY